MEWFKKNCYWTDPTLSVNERRSSSLGLPYWGSGIVTSMPPITSPALKSLFGLLLCTL